jgi:hypothetical protein
MAVKRFEMPVGTIEDDSNFEVMVRVAPALLADWLVSISLLLDQTIDSVAITSEASPDTVVRLAYEHRPHASDDAEISEDGVEFRLTHGTLQAWIDFCLDRYLGRVPMGVDEIELGIPHDTGGRDQRIDLSIAIDTRRPGEWEVTGMGEGLERQIIEQLQQIEDPEALQVATNLYGRLERQGDPELEDITVSVYSIVDTLKYIPDLIELVKQLEERRKAAE